MLDRLLIILKWSLYNSVLFLALNIFLPGLISSLIATIITVGAIFHPENEKEVFKLKRPQIYIKV